ncbi:MAG: PD-(D/E)XK nuclease family transposase, partial [Lachnospiraceae bacterium]|nr:PD-(D/E)XK nuclease family transposase [Lachnospiraceae bacterium]
LDFIPLDGKRKFYSENYLMDIRDHEIYSRNLSVIVIELKEIENAGQAERESGLYQWARLFKAQTWEELKEVAKESETMAKAVVTLKDLSEDDKIKLQCEARYRYEHDMASVRELGRKEGRDEGLDLAAVILDELEAGTSEKEILDKLASEFSLDPERAKYYLKRFKALTPK